VKRERHQKLEKVAKQPPNCQAGTREVGAKLTNGNGGKDEKRRRSVAIAATRRERSAAVRICACAAGVREAAAEKRKDKSITQRHKGAKDAKSEKIKA
jgi:hypothetical protein